MNLPQSKSESDTPSDDKFDEWLLSTIGELGGKKFSKKTSPWIYTDPISEDHYVCGVVVSLESRLDYKCNAVIEHPLGGSSVSYEFDKGRLHFGLKIGEKAWFISPSKSRLTPKKKYIFHYVGDHLRPAHDLEFNSKNHHVKKLFHKLTPGGLPEPLYRDRIRVTHR